MDSGSLLLARHDVLVACLHQFFRSWCKLCRSRIRFAAQGMALKGMAVPGVLLSSRKHQKPLSTSKTGLISWGCNRLSC
jgi:hypothetical protein